MTTVAILDSGVHRSHPHIVEHASRVRIGPNFLDAGAAADAADGGDRLGHGTAVAAAILDLAPAAEVLSLRVFFDRPKASVDRLIAAIDYALTTDATILNLSLGTTDPATIPLWESAVERVRRAGRTLVAPASDFGIASYPGMLPGVGSVILDANLSRESAVRRLVKGRPFWFASPLPRPIDGVPPRSNVLGVSFATANVAAHLARTGEAAF